MDNNESILGNPEITFSNPTDIRKQYRAATGNLALLHTGDEESYTPVEYIDSARLVMGEINLDPASNVITEGCRDPLVVWNTTLIDGHNRYPRCQDSCRLYLKYCE